MDVPILELVAIGLVVALALIAAKGTLVLARRLKALGRDIQETSGTLRSALDEVNGEIQRASDDLARLRGERREGERREMDPVRRSHP